MHVRMGEGVVVEEPPRQPGRHHMHPGWLPSTRDMSSGGGGPEARQRGQGC